MVGIRLLARIACLFGCLLNLPGATPDGSRGEPMVEAFKSFLSDRPRIESIVWRRQLYPGLEKPPTELPAGAMKPQFWHTRWESDALFYTQQFEKRAEVDAINARGMYQGKSNSLGFTILSGILTQQLLTDGVPDGIGNSFSKAFIEEGLNLGLRGVVDKSIKWNGDRFEYRATNGTVQGLLYSENGFPKRIEITAGPMPCFFPGAKQWIEYSYKTPHPAGVLPYSFTFYQQKPGKGAVAAVEYRVYEASFSDTAMDPSLFSPTRFIVPRSDTVFTYTNDAIYYRAEGTKDQYVKLGSGIPVKHSSNLVKQVYFAGLVALILIPALWLGWSKLARRARTEK